MASVAKGGTCLAARRNPSVTLLPFSASSRGYVSGRITVIGADRRWLPVVRNTTTLQSNNSPTNTFQSGKTQSFSRKSDKIPLSAEQTQVPSAPPHSPAFNSSTSFFVSTVLGCASPKTFRHPA